MSCQPRFFSFIPFAQAFMKAAYGILHSSKLEQTVRASATKGSRWALWALRRKYKGGIKAGRYARAL
jgi:hypothetical protein